MDRSALSQALNKAIAFKLAGKQEEANQWASRLIKLLQADGIDPEKAPFPTHATHKR